MSHTIQSVVNNAQGASIALGGVSILGFVDSHYHIIMLVFIALTVFVSAVGVYLNYKVRMRAIDVGRRNSDEHS